MTKNLDEIMRLVLDGSAEGSNQPTDADAGFEFDALARMIASGGPVPSRLDMHEASRLLARLASLLEEQYAIREHLASQIKGIEADLEERLDFVEACLDEMLDAPPWGDGRPPRPEETESSVLALAGQVTNLAGRYRLPAGSVTDILRQTEELCNTLSNQLFDELHRKLERQRKRAGDLKDLWDIVVGARRKVSTARRYLDGQRDELATVRGDQGLAEAMPGSDASRGSDRAEDAQDQLSAMELICSKAELSDSSLSEPILSMRLYALMHEIEDTENELHFVASRHNQWMKRIEELRQELCYHRHCEDREQLVWQIQEGLQPARECYRKLSHTIATADAIRDTLSGMMVDDARVSPNPGNEMMTQVLAWLTGQGRSQSGATEAISEQAVRDLHTLLGPQTGSGVAVSEAVVAEELSADRDPFEELSLNQTTAAGDSGHVPEVVCTQGTKDTAEQSTATQLACPRCGGAKMVKNGRLNGKQRYRCKGCGHRFVPAGKLPRI